MKRIYFLCLLIATIFGSITKTTKASNGYLQVENGWQPESLSQISQLKFKLTKICLAGVYSGSSSEKLSYDIQKYLKDWGIPIISGEITRLEPYMNVSITCEQAEYNYKNTNFKIEIIQPVNIDNESVEAITYKNQVFDLTHIYFYEAEQRVILNLLKQFITDWESARKVE